MKNTFIKAFTLLFAIALAFGLLSVTAFADEQTDTRVCGDVYADGEVNVKDAIFLLQYIAKSATIADEELKYANLFVEDNGEDGAINVNIKDAIILLQSIAKMNVTLGAGKWKTSSAPTTETPGEVWRHVYYGIEKMALPPLNPNFYTTTETLAPTCYSAGEVKYSCTVNGGTFEFKQSVPMLTDHTVVIDEAVKATCLAEGLTEGSHCKWCLTVLKPQEPVQKLPHTPETIYAEAATCQNPGHGAGEKCSVCGTIIVQPETYPVIPHTEVTSGAKDATCTEAGYSGETKCSVCQTVTKPGTEIGALGHGFSNFGTCTRCSASEYIEYTSYSDFINVCNVSESNGVVTITYNQSKAAALNLHLFALSGSKTYVFVFGSNAGKVKMAGNPDAEYRNVRISIAQRDTQFNLMMYDLRLYNFNTIITSDAHTLNIGFFGKNCTVETTKASDGANGQGGQSINTSDTHGKRGGDANVAIRCNGIINITCASNTYLKGGNGGNGGKGGDNNGISGIATNGGNGGPGGNGAHAVYANQINVTFESGYSKANLSVVGGSGGSGGSGGKGGWLMGSDGTTGSGGSSATATNVTVNYLN